MTKQSDLLDLFGKRYDDPTVTQALASMPEHKADKPSDGAQYILSKKGGFEMLFEDPVNRGAGNRQNRTLKAIFFYNEGVQGYARFRGEVPFGFSLDAQRPGLIGRQLPDRTWVIGEGRVPVDHPAPDHDQWAFDGLTISAHYDDDGTTVRYFLVQPASDEPEWQPDPEDTETWQKLALIPERKLDAIKLYRQEHGGGMAEAKAAVESLASAG